MEAPSQEVNIALPETPSISKGNTMDGMGFNADKSGFLKFIEDISPVEMSYILESVIASEDNDGDIEVRIQKQRDTQVMVSIPGEIPFSVLSPFKSWGHSETAECLVVQSHPVKMADMGGKQVEFCVNTANVQFPMSKIFVTEIEGEQVIAIQSSIWTAGGITQENIEARIHAHRRASLMLRTHCNKMAQKGSTSH
jgi:hypothetical protein